MNAQHTTDEHAPATRYDLIIHLPESPDMARLQQQASTQLQLGPEKATRLMQHLEQRGATRIKAGIAQDEAERTAQSFRDAGFQVEMRPTLALLDKQASVADSECPGCQRMMRPTPQRQCPYCQIYLDKIDPEKLRLKQIRDEELRKLNARLQREGELGSRQSQEDSERQLRNRIRAELEKELGLHQPWLAFFRGSRGVLRAGAIVILLGGAFFGGYRLASPSGQPLAPGQQAALAQGVLNRIMGGGLSTQPADLAAFAQSPDGAVLAPGSSDSLLAGKGDADASGEWQGVAASLQKVAAQHGAALGEKQHLALALVVALAESGQAQRANELLARLQATPGYQADSARSAELLANAWVLTQRPGGISTQALDELVTQASQLKPQDAAVFYARVASMLAASPQLSASVWQAWLDKARAQLSQLSGAVMRDYTTSQLLRWQAQAQFNALQANAAKGRWTEVKTLLGQLQASQAATPGPALTLLLSQGELAAGHAPAAAQQLEQAYALAAQAAAKGDPGLVLPALADHQGVLAMAPLLAKLDDVVAAQQANLHAPLYGAMATIAAAAGMEEASALYQQRVAAALTGSEGRDEQILALSVSCSTKLAQYYLRTRQPALAERQLRKSAAVVVPLLPEAPASS